MSEIHHDHQDTEAELEYKKSLRPSVERDNKYWLSLEQWSQDPEFAKLAETEFQSSPLRESEGEDGWARREFLKLMGASLALASAGCIRRPVQKIVPYNKQPEEVTFTVANYYSSAFVDGADFVSTLVKTREGRPIKIEPNPEHPLHQGGLNSRAQAALLSLYDPERIKGPIHNLLNKEKTNSQPVETKWEEADKKITEQLKKGGVVVLTGAISSPSTRAVISDFCQGFKGSHVQWEVLAHDEVREGQMASYGDNVVPQYRFDKSQMTVSIDADFLGTWIAPTTFTRQFSQGRKKIKDMSRLVSFDSTYSLTGANADIRVRIKPSQQLAVVMGLLSYVLPKAGLGDSSAMSVVNSFKTEISELKVEASLLKEIANDLWSNKGESLVVAGGLATKTAQSKELQVAVNYLNTVLGNDGRTILAKAGNPGLLGSTKELLSLIKDMKNGAVQTLIIHRTNPVYALSDDLGFSEALKKVGMVIYTGDRVDETGIKADYITPDNHDLESWNDYELAKGLYTVAQPSIRPMYDTRQFQTSLMTWAFLAEQGPSRLRDYESFYDYLRVYWKTELSSLSKGADFEDFWTSVLHNGYVGSMTDSNAPRSFSMEAFTSIKKPTQVPSEFEIAMYAKVGIGDGTLANIGWLQELPDPITKIVWDNYAMISMDKAKALKLKEGSMIEIKVGESKLSLPVHIQPGLHDDVLAVAIGYGRTRAGKVGNGIGQNVLRLGAVKADQMVYSGLGATVKSLGKKYDLACTQGHHSMEGRAIVAEATLKDYLKSKSAGIHKHQVWNLWSGHQYNGHKWGMSLDLNSCTGCSACVTACQSENNITVIGKKYVLEGREMHWIRIDRYYTGNPVEAEAVFQPVMCQHCDNAPCETVCPVLATVHSDEGLNDMVYNRCVGTRYCANNCPYKVRRFNWFNYAKLIEKPTNMALNPSVGVRVRGVMEKCTFCVQRIQDAKTLARNEKRSLKDGDVKTACQTSCPTNAIVFGDMNDPNSEVAKIFNKEERAYSLLEEWHAKPSVRYLSKIRNNGKETASHDAHGSDGKGGHS